MAITRKVLPVILAGGSGTRLWPLSRENYPKQFLDLVGDQSLFKQTLTRVCDEAVYLPPLVITHEAHRFLVAEQIRECHLPISALMLEPARKGTAPAAALAAQYALQRYGEQTLLMILAADHFIPDGAKFREIVLKALPLAEKSHLITFGVKPTRPETGFGYIEPDQSLSNGEGFAVKAFIEKPPLDVATTFYEQGHHYWNSGMFLFQAKAYLKELTLLAPEMANELQPVWQSLKTDEDFIRFDSALFAQLPEDSIDYAIMEKTTTSAVVPFDTDWHDLGSWKALAEVLPQDKAGNVTLGDVANFDTQNCFLKSDTRLLAAVGVKDLVVVETPDAVLVMDKHHSEALKAMVAHLNAAGREEVVQHQTEHRPWGRFATIVKGERFQVKRITVAVGAQLSLQLHHHRSEHWVVVKGTARVYRGEEVYLLSENQSTYIPIGATHRLENIGKIPLEIIEVQSGSYLGEDDIIRLDDAYGRTQLSPDMVDSAS